MSGVLSKLSFDFGDITLTTVIVKSDTNENKPYFFAKEVASALGFKRTRDAVKRHCVETVSISEFLKGPRFTALVFEGLHPETILIPEGDVYSLIFGSKLKSAIEFRRFVCGVVLPCLRENGTYPPPSKTTSSKPMLKYHDDTHDERMELFKNLSVYVILLEVSVKLRNVVSVKTKMTDKR